MPEASPPENPFQQRSTVDPLQEDFAKVDMLGSLVKKGMPSWVVLLRSFDL